MRLAGLTDAILAAESKQHRTEIWAYRTKRRMPRADTADSILVALRRRGVDLTLGELVGK